MEIEASSGKVTTSKKKLYGIGLMVVVIAAAAFLIYYHKISSMNKLKISELSASRFNLLLTTSPYSQCCDQPLPTCWGWRVTIKIQNVGGNDVYGAEIKVELVCDGIYWDTETETIDKVSVNWEKTTTISVFADPTTTNVLSASERKVIATITLNDVVLDQQILNLQ